MRPLVTKLVGEFQKLSNAEVIQIYSTRIETKAAFAQRTKSSLKNGLYCYMEYYEYNTFTCCFKSSQPWVSEEIVPYTWYQKRSRIPAFCPFCTASQYEEIENPNLKKKKEFTTRSLTHPSGMVAPQCTHKIFEPVANSSRKPPAYTLTNQQDDAIRGKIYQK